MSSYQTNSRMRALLMPLKVSYEWLTKAGLSFAAQLILSCSLVNVRVSWGSSTSDGQFFFHAADLWVLVCFPCLSSSLDQQTSQGMPFS